MAFISDDDIDLDKYSITNDSLSVGDPDGISTTQDLSDDDFIASANQGSTSIALGGTKTLNGKSVTIYSSSNVANTKFVVSGTDMQNANISETILGPNAAGTVRGNKVFKTVTGVTVDKALAAAVKVGISGGSMTINGSLSSSGAATLNGKFISITSEGNNAGIKFVVTGTDMSNAPLTETIVGKNKGITSGTNLFKTVTSIRADGATSGNITAGTLSGKDEGTNITFTINRETNNNKSDTVFLVAKMETAKKEDVSIVNTDGTQWYLTNSGDYLSKVGFKEFEIQKTVTLKATLDNKDDDNEYFSLNLYDSGRSPVFLNKS